MAKYAGVGVRVAGSPRGEKFVSDGTLEPDARLLSFDPNYNVTGGAYPLAESSDIASKKLEERIAAYQERAEQLRLVLAQLQTADAREMITRLIAQYDAMATALKSKQH